ncbi:transposon TX1 putative 149 kDa protein, partial [Trifolium medium]|nr:transposon TX1 putative 149 kDa protein [Trifolium medium]
SMSRIDRVLASGDWLALGENPALWVLPRSISDHCPLVFRFNVVNWGPKPFRFNNHWLENKEFHGPNRETYGVGDEKIEKLISEITRLDLLGESVCLSDDEVKWRKLLFAEVWHLKKSKESMIIQRFRAKWLREGDVNSRYFHACIKSRRKHNSIQALQTNDGWAENATDIRQVIVSFFKNHFSTASWSLPRLDGIMFPLLTGDDNDALTRPFQMIEIQEAVLEADGNKSPGPDVFNFAFVKHFWDLLKGEVR